MAALQTTAVASSSRLAPATSDTEWWGDKNGVRYRMYRSEDEDMAEMMALVDQELSEPYNIYTFRYFLLAWPHLAFLAYPPLSSSSDPTKPIATVICKQESHRGKRSRGYIGMLSVERKWRRKGIARTLAGLAIGQMIRCDADEIVLETEYDNAPSLTLYASLGFMLEKRLHRFYLNGKDAFRLVLPIVKPHPHSTPETEEEAELAREAVGRAPPDLGQPLPHDRPGDMNGLDYTRPSDEIAGVRQGVAGLII